MSDADHVDPLRTFASDLTEAASSPARLKLFRKALVTRYIGEGLAEGSAKTYAGQVCSFVRQFVSALTEDPTPEDIRETIDSTLLRGGRIRATIFRNYPDSLNQLTKAWSAVVQKGKSEIVSIPDTIRRAYSRLYRAVPRMNIKHALSMIMSDVCIRSAGLMARTSSSKLSDIPAIPRPEALELLEMIAAWRRAPYPSAPLFAYPDGTPFSPDLLHTLEMGTWATNRVRARGYFAFYGTGEDEEDYNPDRHEAWLASRSTQVAEGVSPRLDSTSFDPDEIEDFDLNEPLLEGGLLSGAVQPTAGPIRDAFSQLEKDAREEESSP
tara:strand:+ start:1006 stop:1977 length:972 start_codon:yes stop_codon:yes gene_type:complete